MSTAKAKVLEYYITYRGTPLGNFRVIFVMDGKEFIQRGIFSEDEALLFILNARKQGVPFRHPQVKRLEVKK